MSSFPVTMSDKQSCDVNDSLLSTERNYLKRPRHKQLSLQSKLSLLADVDNKIGSKKEIAAKYGIPSNTLSTIVKHRHKVETAAKIFFFEPGRKRMRESNYSNIDRQLFAWVKQAQSRNEPVNSITLTEQAERLAEQLGEIAFKASSGWVDRFKKRHGIMFTQLKNRNGESTSAGASFSGTFSGWDIPQDTDEMSKSNTGRDSVTFPGGESHFDNVDDIGLVISSIFKSPPVNKEAAKEWAKGSLPYVLDEYQPSDIFCADETELFFRCLPDKLQSLSKGKGPRDKVTVLFSVNMTGIEKLPLLVIGKLAVSSSSSVKNLPLDYVVDKSIVMSKCIFDSWLNQVDEKFQDENRRVALVINSSPAHSNLLLTSLKAVKVVFLPFDTSGLLQPCGQGVIHSFKMHYRTRVVQKYLLHARNEINKGNFHCADSFNLSISNALFCMRSAWDQVEKDTVVNSFRHAGFHAKPNHPVIEESVQSHLNHLLERLGQLVPVQTTASDFVDIDNDLKNLHRDLISDVIEDKDSSNGGPVQGAFESVTTSAAIEAVETLKKFAQERDLGEEMFTAISSIECKVESAALKDNVITIKEEIEDDNDNREEIIEGDEKEIEDDKKVEIEDDKKVEIEDDKNVEIEEKDESLLEYKYI